MKGLVGACLAAIVLLLAPGAASAATRTWDGGCGAETAWSCAANWSENTVPASGDAAVFNSTFTGSSSVDSGFGGAVATVTVTSGYTGTLSLARSLTVSTAFSQAAGTFTAGSQALTLKALTLTGGSFTASSGTTSIGGVLKISASPTFNANAGTVNFTGGGATLSCGGKTFNLVTFSHAAGTKTIGSNCSLPLGGSPKADKGGSITLNGTFSGSGTLTTSGTLILGSTGSLSGFSGLVAKNLTVKGSYNFGSYSPFTVGGAFSMTASGNFTAPSGTASVGRNLTINASATFNANGGTLLFNSTSAFALACGGKTFNLVTFESNGRKTVGSDCTLPLGANPDLGTGGTLLNGTLSGTGTLTQTGTFEIGSTSPGLDSFSDVADVGSFILKTGAEFTAPSGTLTVNGNFTINSGASFDANEGTVEFQALPLTTKTISCNEAEFNLVTFTNTSKQVVGSNCTLPLGASPEIGEGGQIVVNGDLTGSGTLTADSLLLTLGSSGGLSGFSGLSSDALLVEGTYDFGAYETFAVGGDFTIGGAGQFTAPEGAASFAGDFVDSGVFEANEGSVELTGTGQALTGSTTFNDLTKVSEASDALTFAAGSTQTIEGALTLEGGGTEALLSLVSSKTGTPWLIAANGTRAVKWVSVEDSTNEGTAISAVESTDAGGNTGWSFP